MLLNASKIAQTGFIDRCLARVHFGLASVKRLTLAITIETMALFFPENRYIFYLTVKILAFFCKFAPRCMFCNLVRTHSPGFISDASYPDLSHKSWGTLSTLILALGYMVFAVFIIQRFKNHLTLSKKIRLLPKCVRFLFLTMDPIMKSN